MQRLNLGKIPVSIFAIGRVFCFYFFQLPENKQKNQSLSKVIAASHSICYQFICMAPTPKSGSALGDQWINLIRHLGFPVALTSFFFYWFFVQYFPEHEKQLRQETANCQKIVQGLSEDVTHIRESVDRIEKNTPPKGGNQ